MNLLRRVAMGVSLIPFLLACADDKTILSVNVNLGSDKLNRRASLWQPIQVTITGSTTETRTLTMQQAEEDVIQLQANGSAVISTDEKMEPVKEKAPAIRNGWFERIELDGWSGDITVTAEASGAYFVDEVVGDKTYPKSVPVTFATGMPTATTGGIEVKHTPVELEENGVTAVFLNFMPPQAPMPMGGNGGGGAAATGGAAAGGAAAGGASAGAGGGAIAGAGGTAAGASGGGVGGGTG